MNIFFHQLPIERLPALDALLRREAAVRLDYLVLRHARHPLERVDVLREAHAQQLPVVQHAHEGVRRRRAELAREELFRKRVDYVCVSV